MTREEWEAAIAAGVIGDEGNLDTPPDEWLAEQFEYELCEECGADADEHDAIPFMGNWFARCQRVVVDA